MKLLLKSVKFLSLILVLGVFMSMDFVSEQGTNNDFEATEITGKLPVVVSCFGCSEGNGMMVASNPYDRNQAFYSDARYDIRWYTSTGKLYASNNYAVDYTCGQSFTVTITDKKTGDRGFGAFEAIPCPTGTVSPAIQEPNRIKYYYMQ